MICPCVKIQYKDMFSNNLPTITITTCILVCTLWCQQFYCLSLPLLRLPPSHSQTTVLRTLVGLHLHLPMPWGSHRARECPMLLKRHWMWSIVVAMYRWHLYASPIHRSQEFPAGPRRPDSSPVIALALHAGTARLGLMGCSPAICFQWWEDVWPHWQQLHHTPCCAWVRRSAGYAHTWDWRSGLCVRATLNACPAAKTTLFQTSKKLWSHLTAC